MNKQNRIYIVGIILLITIVIATIILAITIDASPVFDIVNFVADVLMGIGAIFLTIIQMRRDKKEKDIEMNEKLEEEKKEIQKIENINYLHNTLITLCDNLYIDDYRLELLNTNLESVSVSHLDGLIKKIEKSGSNSLSKADITYIHNAVEFIRGFVGWCENTQNFGDILTKYEDELPPSTLNYVRFIEKISWDDKLNNQYNRCQYFLYEFDTKKISLNSDINKIHVLENVKNIINCSALNLYEKYKIAVTILEKKIDSIQRFYSKNLKDEFQLINAHYISAEQYDDIINKRKAQTNSLIAMEDNDDIIKEWLDDLSNDLKDIETHFKNRIR